MSHKSNEITTNLSEKATEPAQDSSKQFVRDLQDKTQIRSVFLTMDKVLLSDRNGKPYISVKLTDVSGSIDARIWENVERIDPSFNSGDFVWVKGHVQVYQNRKQVVIHDLKPISDDGIDLKDFVKESSKSPKEFYNKLMDYVKSIENPAIRQLLEKTVEEKVLQEKLMKSPAAKTIHHAYIGGLLEHIVSICDVMDMIAQHYTKLDRDYLIFGAIYHDIGKVLELKVEKGIQYSDKGRLVGHMAIACGFIDEYSKEIEEFSEELSDNLKHIVLSHHGRLEYGSPKTPVFPEAMVVAMIDDLDSKLNTVFNFMESELTGGESWTRFHPGMDRYFYLEILKKQLERKK